MFLTAQETKPEDITQPPIEEYARSFILFDHPSLAMALVSQEGAMLQCNQRLHELLKTTEHESLCLDDLTCPDDRWIDADLKQKLLDGDINSYTVEKRFVARNNELIWMNVRVSLAKLDGYDDRHQRYFTVSLEDITESRKVYNALIQTEGKVESLCLK